jgi:hypothetical protein
MRQPCLWWHFAAAGAGAGVGTVGAAAGGGETVAEATWGEDAGAGLLPPPTWTFVPGAVTATFAPDDAWAPETAAEVPGAFTFTWNSLQEKYAIAGGGWPVRAAAAHGTDCRSGYWRSGSKLIA